MMSPRVSVPKIDPRRAADLLRQLRRTAPHYTPEWPGKDEDDPGVALLKIFSSIGEGVISRLNRAPDRNFLAFLDMLGIRLLPATPARAPVHFLLAKGTEEAFLVPRRTQVSAAATAERPEEVPFETITNLWAIPAKLTELIAVSPEKDQIYKPPPKFLENEVAASELPPLRVTAFSAAKSKFLQLDPPKQVKEGDFLRIEQPLSKVSQTKDCVPTADQGEQRVIDHLVVKAEKGSIVTVEDPLPRDYVEGTDVLRETQFELFEAKDWQEHILFLGHEEYFAIKSEAQIELSIELAPGASANLPVLDIVWEFFGVTDKVKEEGWQRFEVDVDGTQGFSRDGRVVLIKPPGEINEKEINGNNSRWIRAKLAKPLPATPPRPPLPKIESIKVVVSYKGEDLAADQAFHNDTPLTTATAFNPFGTEPRIFDRFSIASEEAFSKLGAEVTLDFQLDFTDLLASPRAIFNSERIRAFAHGAAGRLVEFQIDPLTSIADVVPHKSPTDKRLVGGLLPAVVEDANKNIAVFAQVDDGSIHVRTIPLANPGGAAWTLIPPDGLQGDIEFGPAAVLSEGQWTVCVVADNRVYKKFVSFNLSSPSGWAELASLDPLNRPAADSTPVLLEVTVAGQKKVWVAVTDQQGHTWVHDGDQTWRDLWAEIDPSDDAFLAKKNARPDMVLYTDSNSLEQAKIFLRSAADQVVMLNTEPKGTATPPKELTPLPGNILVESNPYVFPRQENGTVFVRGSDKQLWTLSTPAATEWKQQTNPLDASLAGDPVALSYTIDTDEEENVEVLSVLSTSNKNLLLEFRTQGPPLATGQLAAGPDQILMLEEELPSSPPDHFVHITSGPGAGSENDATRKISFAEDEFAVLDSPLDEIPDSETRYDLFELKEPGQVTQDALNDDEVALKASTTAAEDDFVFVRGQLRQITNKAGDIVTVDDPWDELPQDGDNYFVLNQINEDPQEAGEGSARRVVLGTVTPPITEFEDRFLRIDFPGRNPVRRKIEEFITAINGVVLEEDLPAAPPPDAGFAITESDLESGWRAYGDPNQPELRPELSWEYFNGKGWVHLPVNDTTENFLVPGNVVFTVPDDIEKTEVAGQENYWIRTRIVGGDYGRELFLVDPKTNQITIKKDPIRPPRVTKLAIRYELTEFKDPQFCLTFNNLNYLDQTAANTTEDKHFQPYVTLSDTNQAVYFGFDRAFDSGPVRIYFAAKELEVDETKKPKLTWEFAFDNDWKTVLADDDTEAFTKPEFVSLTLPKGFQNTQLFGKALYWLRATLSEGSWPASPLFRGVFVNTVEALQARTISDEILGSSTGVANQKFQFDHTPIIEREAIRVPEALTDLEREQLISDLGKIEGEEIRVREALTDLEREQLISDLGKDAVLVIQDEQGRVIETWIRWTEVLEFFDSDSNSRHYRLDRHTGELEFGDGVRGRIPPPGGDNIRAFSYQEGGGEAGNVLPGEIKSLVTAVAGVDTVINPVAAGGGSEAATNDDMLEIGPEQISNRGRAVTPDDFEQLAREASREVRKALCLPNRNAGGRHEVGWTSVHIVPDSKDAEPMPSLELRRAVERYLAERADVTMVDQKRLFVGPPSYVPVSVVVTVFARSLDLVSIAEQNVQTKLDEFLHPLTGGAANEGWDFGRDLAASDLYTLLEDIDEVDHVESLRLRFGNQESEERVEVGPNALLASGAHRITMDVATGD